MHTTTTPDWKAAVAHRATVRDSLTAGEDYEIRWTGPGGRPRPKAHAARHNDSLNVECLRCGWASTHFRGTAPRPGRPIAPADLEEAAVSSIVGHIIDWGCPHRPGDARR